MVGYQSYLRKKKENGRKMVRFLSEALDQAKEEIASGCKEALTNFHQLKRKVREREAEL